MPGAISARPELNNSMKLYLLNNYLKPFSYQEEPSGSTNILGETALFTPQIAAPLPFVISYETEAKILWHALLPTHHMGCHSNWKLP